MSKESLAGYLNKQNALKKYTNFAFAVLVLNILVILWGAVVRATGSGAGCGSHWPLCNGEVVPLQPEIETLIEFSHRLTSGLAFLGVAGLVLWARKLYAPGDIVRRFAWLSFIFIVIESLIGAGLVLFELVGQNTSLARATVVSVHLLNTLILLAFLALTWWRSRFLRAENQSSVSRFPTRAGWAIFALFILLIGVSGAIAALGNTLFPSQSLVEGIQKDLDQTSHFLIRLRVFHPVFAISGAFLVLTMLYRAIEQDGRLLVRRLGWMVIGFGILQLAAGFLTLILLAPVWMQIVHLFIADLLWITFVIFLDTKRHSYLPGE
ncbi:MAG: Heme A synthase, cytochrome oxidase biogenesis protein Cox15-CtaA [Anaerolineae bacterium]|jgi:heme A synthase|nr:MAG: Heme A synthase, cytochrome oxidase biogenesis protein Cox15-CtaA [Anaerolineae bacterium]